MKEKKASTLRAIHQAGGNPMHNRKGLPLDRARYNALHDVFLQEHKDDDTG